MSGGRNSCPSIAGAAWLDDPALKRLAAALDPEGKGASLRAVGGAVRNTLLGEPITDVDLATPLTPEDVAQRAGAAGLAVHPTGLAHGTLTVVAGGHPFEITTLRRDVETDGRHAVVAYTTDWRQDAGRRDFTINALYSSLDGTVFDYFGGLADLEAHRVRFIGEAEERIREDYLRILRFFRFTAEYGQGPSDPAGLLACAKLKHGLARISAERIGAEMMKLVVAPRAGEIACAMHGASILEAVLGPGMQPERLVRLQAIESANGLALSLAPRFASLLPSPATRNVNDIAQRLRLSNDLAEAIGAALLPSPAYDPTTPERAARAWLYRQGAETFRYGARVAWAASNARADDAPRRDRLLLPERWTPPALPLRGADIVALGMAPGEKIGRILAEFEAWWIEADFPANAALHTEKLNEALKKHL